MEDIFIKIKSLRKKQGMTLKDLSLRTDLSVSFLSQIERGMTSLAITSLKKIADALGESMVYFFEEEATLNYAVYENEQKPFRIGSSDVTLVNLSKHFPERTMDTFIVRLCPGHQDVELVQHPGEEFYYVIEGEVVIYIGEKRYSLKKGDAIHFPSTLLHKWENPLERETVLISSVSPAVF